MLKNILANGGVDIPGNTLTFVGAHNFKTGQKIVYNSNGNQPLGVALTLGSDDITQYDPESTLQNGVTYFANVINTTTIKLHETEDDANAGVATVGITTFNTLGIHKFRSFDFKIKFKIFLLLLKVPIIQKELMKLKQLVSVQELIVSL